MMRTTKLFISALALGTAVLFGACDDDEATIGGGGSVPVADGFYIAKVGVTPTTSDGLKAEKVETDGFGTKDRTGFFANFVYLTAGNYNIVNVISQEIAQTYGGTLATVGTTGSDCNLHSYSLIEEYALNGAAFAVANAGLYKVGVDVTTKEVWLVKVDKVHIIGGATDFGWSQNDAGEMSLVGSATADAATFRKTGIVLKKGDWKFRFNCRWSIDRRIDPGAGFADNNGYVAFTNFGGTITYGTGADVNKANSTQLLPGGSNISIPFGKDGTYTVTAAWTKAQGFKLSLENTAPIAAKPVNDYAWGIVGSATPNGWPNDDTADDPIGVDHSLPLLGGSTATNATYELGSITLSEGGEFKIRANKAWSIVLKPGIDILGTVTGDSGFESTGGGDPNWKVKVGGGGSYKVTVATTNSGEKWNLTFVKNVAAPAQ
jgi:hypothetical protein